MSHAPKACQKKKEKKRCIPKEGMPHAHKACQKKERKKKNIAHTKKIQEKENSCKGVPPPSTKNIHTLALLDQSL